MYKRFVNTIIEALKAEGEKTQTELNKVLKDLKYWENIYREFCDDRKKAYNRAVQTESVPTQDELFLIKFIKSYEIEGELFERVMCFLRGAHGTVISAESLRPSSSIRFQDEFSWVQDHGNFLKKKTDELAENLEKLRSRRSKINETILRIQEDTEGIK